MRFAPAQVDLEKRADGTLLLRSPQKLEPYSRCITEWLVQWSDQTPSRPFLAERRGEAWRTVSYREAYGAARRIGQALIERGLGAEKPVAILSDNSIDHALLALGAMHVGIPAAPVSPAYSLMSKDFGKLKAIFELLKRGLVYAGEPEKFGAALEAVKAKSTPVAELLETNPGSTLEREHLKVRPDSVAKILFTSGSTGIPKGVINTHRMLCANQQMLAQAWPFVEDKPPVLVDWLPWNHTFGGNHNFNLVLRNGGTLYIDGAKPVPGLVKPTVRNRKEIAPSLYFNVPRGYDLLLPYLERDAARGCAAAPFASARSCSTPPRRCRKISGTGCCGSRTRKSAAATSPCSRPGARPRPPRSRPRCTSRWTGLASSACRWRA